jgi:hypothetical protein
MVDRVDRNEVEKLVKRIQQEQNMQAYYLELAEEHRKLSIYLTKKLKLQLQEQFKQQEVEQKNKQQAQTKKAWTKEDAEAIAGLLNFLFGEEENAKA